uniref:Uncharacterized protein n=1 Tax=Oreochromis aureus TaxID=47969 RepID=A0AAZ1WWS3_OREAU
GTVSRDEDVWAGWLWLGRASDLQRRQVAVAGTGPSDPPAETGGCGWTGPSDPPAETGGCGWTGPSDPPAETNKGWCGSPEPPAGTEGWTGPSDPPAETNKGWFGSPEPPAGTTDEGRTGPLDPPAGPGCRTGDGGEEWRWRGRRFLLEEGTGGEMETSSSSSDHIAARKKAGERTGERDPRWRGEGEEVRGSGAETLSRCGDRCGSCFTASSDRCCIGVGCVQAGMVDP